MIYYLKKLNGQKPVMNVRWRSCLINILIKNTESSMSRRHMAILIVGLGNHELPKTRHNIGMMTTDSLAENLSVSWKYSRKCRGDIATCKISGRNVVLLKPRVPMNVSGKSIVKTVRMFNIQLNEIIVLHDDLDRDLGKISLKHQGSASGHNGVKSTINYLGSDVFRRIRIGIGRPSETHQVIDYVLQEFAADELELVQECISRASDVVHKQMISTC